MLEDLFMDYIKSGLIKPLKKIVPDANLWPHVNCLDQKNFAY